MVPSVLAVAGFAVVSAADPNYAAATAVFVPHSRIDLAADGTPGLVWADWLGFDESGEHVAVEWSGAIPTCIHVYRVADRKLVMRIKTSRSSWRNPAANILFTHEGRPALSYNTSTGIATAFAAANGVDIARTELKMVTVPGIWGVSTALPRPIVKPGDAVGALVVNDESGVSVVTAAGGPGVSATKCDIALPANSGGNIAHFGVSDGCGLFAYTTGPDANFRVSVYLCETKSPEKCTLVRSGAVPVARFAFIESKSLLIYSTVDGRVSLYNYKTKALAESEDVTERTIMGIAPVDDNTLMMATTSRGSLRNLILFDCTTLKGRPVESGHENGFSSLAYNKKSGLCAVGSANAVTILKKK